MKQFSAILLLAVFLASCGSSKDSETTGTLLNGLNGSPGLKFFVLEGAPTLSNGVVSGAGSIIFESPLSKKTEAASNFGLSFTLNDGGAVTLIANANNKLASGMEIKFSRAGDALTTTLTADGKTLDISEDIPADAFDLNSPIQLSVDLHNAENPAHILIWKTLEANDTTKIFNSSCDHDHDHDHKHGEHEDEDHDHEHKTESPGRGRGDFWGVKVENATLNAALLREARESHD